MLGYTEVLQVIGAMIIFSMVLMTSNRVMLLNSQQEVESEAEVKAISIAQSLINEARSLPFDENSKNGPPSNIPDDFSNTGPDGETRINYDDFDDFHNWSETVDWEPGSGDGSFEVDIQVLYVSPPNYDMSSGGSGTYTKYKKMLVTVTSDYITDSDGNKIEIQVPYLRSYFKQ